MSTVVICQSAQDDPAQANSLLDRVRGRVKTVFFPSLYDVPETSPLWQKLGVLPGPVAVFTLLYPQAGQWLLAKHGLLTPQFRAFSFRAMPNEVELEQAIQTQGVALPLNGMEDWREALPPRWYPVINRELCTNCLQCLQFCLFGVYESSSAGELIVKHPDQCKPGCPACARVCPTGAILFPMYARDPHIAGAEGNISSAVQGAPALQPLNKPAFDDLDNLVDQMEQVMQRRQP